ncbi:MAG: endo-1,4-beta-xylanase [candidate division KSB1 bacterium]|nr:endo-1,4-beta-xylanase [candidate division KSB1 bacterium]
MGVVRIDKAMRCAVAVVAALATRVPLLQGQADTIQTNVPALKDVFAKDFYIGCLLSYRHIGFPDDPYVPGQSPVVAPNGGYLIKYHMNSMSPGNNMKPQYTVDIAASAAAYANARTQAERDSIDVHPIVRFNGDLIAQLNWAKRQGFTFRGHVLVWHNQTPAAFFRSGYTDNGPRLSKEKMTQRMENYIKEVIRLLHEGWPGLLSAMDVVNEAVLDNGADRTDSEWYRTFGDNSYILKAFEFTRKYCNLYGETQIKLYYNDYNTHLPAKADGIVRVCRPIFEAGYLDGIGMQEHDGLTYPTAEQWIASYEKFYPICHEMAVTELDVATGYASPPPEILAKQANQYAQLFKCFVERSYFSGRGKIISVSKDGLNDQYTFKTNQSSSLWDARNQCKPAFYAVVDVGIYYNRLDSLRKALADLRAEDFTPGSWQRFEEAMAAARIAMERNYSVDQSAAEALRQACVALEAAAEALEKRESAVPLANNVPSSFSLDQNYPNPFNSSTTVEFALDAPCDVRLLIYDLRGHLVGEAARGRYEAGRHRVTVDGTSLSSGTYVYRLIAGGRSETRRFTVVR